MSRCHYKFSCGENKMRKDKLSEVTPKTRKGKRNHIFEFFTFLALLCILVCQTRPLALYNMILFKCNNYINDKMTYLNHQVLTFCNVMLFLN